MRPLHEVDCSLVSSIKFLIHNNHTTCIIIIIFINPPPTEGVRGIIKLVMSVRPSFRPSVRHLISLTVNDIKLNLGSYNS